MSLSFPRRRNISTTISLAKEEIKESEIHLSIINEIRKKNFNNEHIKEFSKFRISTYIQSFDLSGTKRDLQLIIYLLKKIDLFSEFIDYYKLTEDALEIYANNITHQHIGANIIVIAQNEPSDYFYCLLHGKVKVTKVFQLKNVAPYTKEEVIEEVQEELFVKSNGYCFGEKELIFKHPYSFTVTTLEPSDFLLLDKESFKNSLYKYICKKEMDTRSYVRNCLFSKIDIGFVNFENLFENILPISFIENPDNLVLFKEGEKAKFLYIIVKSSFILSKNGMNILTLVEGGVIGIETLFDQEHYLYSVTTYNSSGFLYAIDVSKLNHKILNRLRDNFRENYEHFIKIIHERKEAKVKVAKYEKMHYNIGKNGILNLNEKMNNEIKEKFKLIKQKNVGLLKFKPKRMKTVKGTSIYLKTEPTVNPYYSPTKNYNTENIKNNNRIEFIHSRTFTLQEPPPNIEKQKTKCGGNSFSVINARTLYNSPQKKHSTYANSGLDSSSTTMFRLSSKSPRIPRIFSAVSEFKNENSIKNSRNLKNFDLYNFSNKVIVSEGVKGVLQDFYKLKNKKNSKVDTGMFQIPLACELIKDQKMSE